MEAVSSIQELIRVIGTKSPKFSSAKSMVVEIKTWDDRVVRGSNYKGSKRPEVISIRVPCIDSSIDSNLLWSNVKRLLKTGKSFIIRIGPSCDACLSEWTIGDN